MTTSAIRRRYGWGAGRLCIESQHTRYHSTPPLLPNASSGAATVLVGGLAVFALIRAIQPPEEPPSEIQIVQLQDIPEPPPREPPPPEPEPEPVVVAKAEPPPKPKLVKKPDPPKRREKPAPKPKPEAVRIEPEPAPMWKSAPITPPPPKPKAEPPPPARRPPPKVEPVKPIPMPEPEVAESAPAWKPVAIAEAPKPKAAAPKVSIDAVRAPSSAPPELPSRQASLPPGVPAAPKTIVRKAPAGLRPVIPAAPSADTSADSAAPSYSRSAAPTPVTAPVTYRAQPKGVAMPGVSNTASSRDYAAATGARGKVDRPGVEAPRQEAGRSQPNARLRGVPLGSLAACRTDRLEDDLKQKVLAAVRNREECSSSAGHYRFVETKNLNAFLMWIERAPGRAEGDRCAELSYALSCLRGGGR